MTRGTSTTTEWISASSDLMDAGSNDCALAKVVVQTIPPMNQRRSNARFMRADYSHREVGIVRLVWLESVGDVQLHLLGIVEPGALEAAAHADSQNLGIGPVRRTATSEDAHLTPPSHWLPGRGTLYGGRAGREPLSLNAGDPTLTVLALVSSSAHKKRHGVPDSSERFPAQGLQDLVTVWLFSEEGLNCIAIKAPIRPGSAGDACTAR